MMQVYTYWALVSKLGETIWRNWELKKENQKRILKKQDERAWTEFIWLSTGICSGL
jgi:hypothetical protein